MKYEKTYLTPYHYPQTGDKFSMLGLNFKLHEGNWELLESIPPIGGTINIRSYSSREWDYYYYDFKVMVVKENQLLVIESDSDSYTRQNFQKLKKPTKKFRFDFIVKSQHWFYDDRITESSLVVTAASLKEAAVKAAKLSLHKNVAKVTVFHEGTPLLISSRKSY